MDKKEIKKLAVKTASSFFEVSKNSTAFKLASIEASLKTVYKNVENLKEFLNSFRSEYIKRDSKGFSNPSKYLKTCLVLLNLSKEERKQINQYKAVDLLNLSTLKPFSFTKTEKGYSLNLSQVKYNLKEVEKVVIAGIEKKEQSKLKRLKTAQQKEKIASEQLEKVVQTKLNNKLFNFVEKVKDVIKSEIPKISDEKMAKIEEKLISSLKKDEKTA
jgi:hypothetical protein